MEVEDKHISNICNVIGKNGKYENPLDVLKDEITLYLNLSNIENIQDIFLELKDRGKQEFLGAVFLRFYANYNTIIENNTKLKHQIVSLFDLLYEHSIYKKNKIGSKTQTHIKLPILVKHINNIETNIKEIRLDDLKQFNGFKNKYLPLLKKNNKRPENGIIYHFLNKEIIADIKKIFTLVDEYIKTSDIKVFYELKEKFQKNIELLETIDSEYNNLFLLIPLMSVYNVLKDDFNTNNPEAKTSKLILSSTGKRYPLNVLKSDINLMIKLVNEDEGKAYDTKIEILKTNILTLKETENRIGTIDAKKSVLIKFNSSIHTVCKELKVDVKVTWKDYTQKEFIIEKRLVFKKQRTDINWDDFEDAECYSREAIDDENEFIGRKDILDDLYKGLNKNKNIKSYYIHGQKRVGKTSIAKVLQSRLEKEKDKFLVLYIEGGDYVDGENFKNTINNLGEIICKKIKRTNKDLLKIDIPSFKGSLQPLVNFLEDVTHIDNKKIVFILDEFDEVSSTLYKRNEIGNAFFLTIRSLSNKSNYSFILVGGEKINFIISIQGEQLNKFKSHRVDYFDKEYWNDFKDLVKVPVKKYLDITDEAINKLYDSTAGNPFFTNLICEKMMEIAIEKRDSFITHVEIEESIDKAISNAETQIFSHFWEDGIREDNREEEISYKRRRILLTLAELEKNKDILNENKILDKLVDEMSEGSIKEILKEFVERTILVERNKNYTFRIKFFQKWLLMKGSKEIITTLSEPQKIKLRQKEEKNAEISASEIKQFLENKKIIYNGDKLTSDDIRLWLEQFGDNIKKRMVFGILENLTYYGISNIKIKMKEIFNSIKEKKYVGNTGKRVRNILVSYLDEIGKSGPEYIKYFLDENSILQKNSIERSKILDKLNNSKEDIDYLVFIDDFIGTGNSIITNIKKLNKDYPDIFKKDIEIIIGVITGFLDAKEFIERELEKIKINNIKIVLCEPLNEEDKYFSEKSKYFKNEDDKRNLKDLVWEKGNELVKSHPLGYGECQATIIFPDTCPNNCLPILWVENENFTPLFKRKIN